MTKNLLSERAKTHGLFKDNAKVSQELELVLSKYGYNYTELNCVKREALKAICQKLARIVNGDANFYDHWVDIQGYCQLVLDDMEDSLPKFSDLYGIAPNATNGVPAEEFIEKIRKNHE